MAENIAKAFRYAVVIVLMSQTGARADACSDYDQKITKKYAGPSASAATACQKTAVIIKMLEAGLKGPPGCLTPSEKAKFRAGLSQSRQSYEDQGCS